MCLLLAITVLRALSFQFLPSFSLLVSVFAMLKVPAQRQQSQAPKKSASPRASVRASTAAASSSSSQAKRPRRTTTPAQAQAPDTASTVQASQHDDLVSPQFLETLVSRVADEVSRRMAASETPATSPLFRRFQLVHQVAQTQLRQHPMLP